MLLSKLTKLSLIGPDVEITGVTEDSRKVEPGFLFIATPGLKQDGREFIPDALKKGALAVMIPEGTEAVPSVTTIKTPDIRIETAAFAAAFYPRQPEVIMAVTGTSGKTSTAQFARELAQALGHPSASIGTLGVVTAEGAHYGVLTTPDAITMHRLLDECAGKGITHVSMETSSHGIDFHRLDSVKFKVGAFTNLSRDHLDFYPTMEAYFEAKKGLFSRLLPQGAAAVLNADIPEYEPLLEIAKARKLNVISFGKNGKELRLIDVRSDSGRQILTVEAFGKSLEVALPVLGGFQVWNALCASGLVIGGGEDPVRTVEALAKMTVVPGRLQFIGKTKTGGEVFVDYAHKPGAVENVLSAMRPYVEAHKAKLGIIFGCGGNRDKGKRPMMGEIAEKNADWVIVTDDNPRFEEADVIRSEIMAACKDRAKVHEVGDRRAAIVEGINKLGAHDVVIIAGKGHEPGQIVKDKVLPFDDAEEARKVLGL